MTKHKKKHAIIKKKKKEKENLIFSTSQDSFCVLILLSDRLETSYVLYILYTVHL